MSYRPFLKGTSLSQKRHGRVAPRNNFVHRDGQRGFLLRNATVRERMQ